VVLVGGYHKPLTVDLSRIVWPEVMITGSNCYGYSGLQTDFQMAIDLIAGGKVDVTKIVTHRLPLQAITQAFAIAADKSLGAVKVHLVNQAAPSSANESL
jgi:threonine dehydrogenase-like Zn-dependent dehydrogenase